MSSSSLEEIDEDRSIKKFLTLSRKKYGQRIPKELQELRSKANTQYIFGEIEETKKSLETIIKKYPFYQEAYQVYGLICLDQNNMSKATNYFMLAAKRKGTSTLWLKIANLLKSQSRFDLASIYFGKVLKKNQMNIGVMWERVDCFEKSGEYSKGIIQLEKLEQIATQLKIDGLREQALKRMAKLYVKKQSYEDAKRVLNKLEMSDSIVNMLCEIMELEQKYEEMRQLLDSTFGNKNMRTILKTHDYRIISFYVLCGFKDYQQLVDAYQNNQQAISHLIDLSEKLDKQEKDKLIEILYQYRNSYSKDIKDKILFKYANNPDHNEIFEIPEEPELPNTQDQILFIYNKIKSENDPTLVAQHYLKILSYEQKSYLKSNQIQLIRREDTSYIFGRQHKKRRLSKFMKLHSTKGQQSLSTQIGHEKFFNLAIFVFKILLDNNLSSELFQATYKTYQLRLKKIASQDISNYLDFMQQLSKYGLWSALMEKQYLIAPLYLRYVQNEPLLLHLIQIMQKHISPEHRGIINSFTRSLNHFENSVLQNSLSINLKTHAENPKDPLINLILALTYLQIMTGRLAIKQEDWLKQGLFYFDQYRVNTQDQVEIFYNLGRIYLHLNIVSKGQELMEKVVEFENHPLRLKAGFTLMQLHKRMGNNEQALYYLRKYNTI